MAKIVRRPYQKGLEKYSYCIQCTGHKVPSERLGFAGAFWSQTHTHGIFGISLGAEAFDARRQARLDEGPICHGRVFFRVLCHFLRFCLFFLGKTLFSYGFRGISLGLFWFFVGKTLFSYGFRVISLGFQNVALVVPRENPIFLTFSHS